MGLENVLSDPWSPDWAPAYGRERKKATGRTLLTGPAAFYADTELGRAANEGLDPADPLPQPQDVIERLYAEYDLGGQSVQIYCADGQEFDGVSLLGPFVGQQGANVVIHGGSTLGASIFRPSGTKFGVGLAFGAMAQILNVTCDNSAGHNDCIAVGQGSRLVMLGDNRLIQNNTDGFNHITAYSNCTIDVTPFPTLGNLYFKGRAQCGMQLDASSVLQSNCNFTHGLLSFWAEADAAGHQPYWSDAFVDVAVGSKAILGGTDFHGTGSGYRYRIREGGVVQLNLEGDPGQLAAMFGSQNTAWPVQGYLY